METSPAAASSCFCSYCCCCGGFSFFFSSFPSFSSSSFRLYNYDISRINTTVMKTDPANEDVANAMKHKYMSCASVSKH